MRQAIQYAAMFIGFAALAAVISGCGGSGGSSPTTQPFSGQYQAVFLESVSGNVSIDNNGLGTLVLHASGATPSLILNFCNFGHANGCVNISQFSGDTAGNLNTKFAFPEHGPVAGFFAATLNGTQNIEAGFFTPNRTDIFTAVLLPANSLSQGIGSWSPTPGAGSDTGSGTVSIGSGASTAHFVLNGAPANATYIAEFCTGDAFDPNSCKLLGKLSTNASGGGTFDGSVSFPGSSGTFGIFVLTRQVDPSSAPVEFVSGFRVP